MSELKWQNATKSNYSGTLPVYKSYVQVMLQRMKRPSCRVSMPLLLRHLARVMHPALSKELYMEWRSQSQEISHLSAFFSLFCWTGKCPKALALAPRLCLWALDSLYCLSMHPAVGCIWNCRELVWLIYLWTHPLLAYLIWFLIFRNDCPTFCADLCRVVDLHVWACIPLVPRLL